MSEVDPFNLDERTQKRATKARVERDRQAVEAADFRRLMGKDWGRRIVWRLLESAGVFRLSFDPDSERRTAFAEGGRNYGLRVLNHVFTLCPDLFVLMRNENSNDNDDHASRQRTRRAAGQQPASDDDE